MLHALYSYRGIGETVCYLFLSYAWRRLYVWGLGRGWGLVSYTCKLLFLILLIQHIHGKAFLTENNLQDGFLYHYYSAIITKTLSSVWKFIDIYITINSILTHVYIDTSGACSPGCKVIHSWSCVKMSWDVVKSYNYKGRPNKAPNTNCFPNKYFWNLTTVNTKNIYIII